jgi:hypothetical protein
MTQRRARARLGTVAAGAVVALLGSGPAHAAPAEPSVAPAPPTNAWAADLSAIDGDDVNVASVGGVLRTADPANAPASQRGGPAEGTLLLSPHPLATPANRVLAQVDADAPKGSAVAVEVRALTGKGEWSEWRTAGDPLAAPATEVQVRITLTGGQATVRQVRLTADTIAAPRAGTAAVGLTSRVYATREGLVGGTTANGHVIVSRDHFVALPSRRGLSPKGTGDYTVRVCTTSGSRCEYAPVWDVGPWNTTDDYWNPAGTRQSWGDLPQGRPEAQAAYQSGYNGGRDQFGRTVANPAGIDLADGTFWDGLQLTDNSWVDVAYLWTGSGPRGLVGSGPLNIRSGAGTGYASKGYAAQYARVPIECWVTGQSVAGPYGTTTRWDRIGAGQYISHGYVSSTSGGAAPAC